MSSLTEPDGHVPSFLVNVTDVDANAERINLDEVDHPNRRNLGFDREEEEEEEEEEEADSPPISLPSTWKRGNISFVSESGNPIPKFIFSPKSFLIIPADELESTVDDSFEVLANYLRDKGGWNLGVPKILINTIGDIQHSHFSPDLLKSVIKSLFRMTDNTWIFTEGYRTYFNKIVGFGVKDIGRKCNMIENKECNVRVTSLGICHWDNIVGKEKIENGEDYDMEQHFPFCQ